MEGVAVAVDVLGKRIAELELEVAQERQARLDAEQAAIQLSETLNRRRVADDQGGGDHGPVT